MRSWSWSSVLFLLGYAIGTVVGFGLYYISEVLITDNQPVKAGQLIARLERRRPDLYLLPLRQGRPSGALFTLRQGELQPVNCRGLWLSESFAEQEGWLVREERIRWKDWLARLSKKEQEAGRLAG